MVRADWRKILTVIIFVVLLFISALEDLTGIAVVDAVFQHVDEFLALVLTVYVGINIRACFKEKMDIVLIWIMFMCTGALSSAMCQYQGILPTLMDAIVIVNRFMMGYLAAIIYIRKNNPQITDCLDIVARVITVVMFFFCIHDIFFTPWFENAGEYEYFTYVLKLVFPHPTYLASAMITLLILLGYRNEHYRNIVYMIMATFVTVTTFRTKAIGFLLVYWAMYIFIMVLKNKKYLIIMGFGALLAMIVASEKIAIYFIDNSYSARSILLVNGLKLMRMYFPLGTGFATYGSTIATTYYSPVYDILGFDAYYGLNRLFSGYLSDSFWPIIFAQFGAVGTVLFVGLVIYFLRNAIIKLRYDKLAGFAMLMTIIYMLIASVAESAFFNPVAFLIFMMYAVYEKEDRVVKKCGVRFVAK